MWTQLSWQSVRFAVERLLKDLAEGQDFDYPSLHILKIFTQLGDIVQWLVCSALTRSTRVRISVSPHLFSDGNIKKMTPSHSGIAAVYGPFKKDQRLPNQLFLLGSIPSGVSFFQLLCHSRKMVISSGCDPEIPSSILGCGTLSSHLFFYYYYHYYY